MNEQDFSPVFDGHCDTATRIFTDSKFDLGKRNTEGHIDIPRMKEGGLNAQIFAVYTDPNYKDNLWEEITFETIQAFRKAVEANKKEIGLALSGNDIRRILNEGRIAAMIGVEGGHVVSSLEVLGKLYRWGMRCLTITWKNTNSMADSSEDIERWGGLSDFGREVIAEMDRLGIIIDCSHASRGTFFEILDLSINPVILSHSCMRAICNIPR
ncbi:membrane dipeptidase, partial [bacterium]|nr:membrane dipeptidase [bacterium]